MHPIRIYNSWIVHISGESQFGQWSRLLQDQNALAKRANIPGEYKMRCKTERINSDHKKQVQDGLPQNGNFKGSELIENHPEFISQALNGNLSTSWEEEGDKAMGSKNSARFQHQREDSKKRTSGLNITNSKPPYKCDQCGKTFKTKYTLTIHLKMPSHTGAKPFVCAICGKGFRLSSTLCRHKIIHTSEKPHKCHICDKAFNRSSTLKTHIRTHSELKEFVCDICGKGFHQKGNLRNHILIHTGEKPYHCNLCEKSFNKLSNLKFHRHIHTDNAPYRCRYCKTCFTRRCDLKLHIVECNKQN